MIKQDKLQHLLYSYAATTLAAVFMPIGWAAVGAGVVGAIKEIYIDGKLRRGTPEWADFLADVVGIILACVVVGRW